MVTRIGWFSDCHLGLAQYGLQARYDDMFKAVEFVIDDMATKGIRTAICTGDLLNSTRPSPETVHRLKELGFRMERRGVDCLTLMGNHDLTPAPNWVDLVGTGNLGWRRPVKEAGTVWLGPFMGFDFCSNERLRSFNYNPLPGLGVQVLGIHAAVQEFVRFKSDSMISIKDLPLDGRFAAVLLGDIHICDLRQTADGVLYGYPGSTELCSESELDTKYWVELILENKRVVEFKKHQINTRPVLRWQINTEPELVQVMVDLGQFLPEHKGVRNPIIYLRYDPSLTDVVARVRQVNGAQNVILRTLALDTAEPEAVADPGLLETEKIDPVALLRQAVPEGRLQVLAERLLVPSQEAKPLLREFVEERLK